MARTTSTATLIPIKIRFLRSNIVNSLINSSLIIDDQVFHIHKIYSTPAESPVGQTLSLLALFASVVPDSM